MGDNVETPDNYPKLKQYDAWCRRVDEITTAPGWKALNDVAAEEGLIAIGYERRYKEYSRVYQFAKQYLYAPSSAMYACPLSMTDGAARVLELIGTEEMKKQYYSRLISRDPAKFWTSGQWMTERPGGSDVSRSETQAKLLDPTTNTWSISGFKWFSSATTADLTMLLARSVNTQNGTVKTGSKGLSLYIAEMRLPNGQLNGVRVHRLKNKYGTKGLPTAELELNRMQAKMLGKPGRGVPCIAAILNITRIYACLGVVCSLRRSLAIAKDFAGKRQAFGKRLDQTPLHITTLADLELVFRAGAQLAFYCIQLLGRTECSHHGSSSNNDNEDMVILRFLTPIAKAYVCKMGVTACSEAMEALGGQGYMEEIGIGRQLRDAQVNTIWEGTTNVLAMDVLRVMRETKGQCLLTFEKVVKDKTKYAKAIFKDDQTTSKIIQAIDTAMQNIKKFVASSSIQENKAEVEANARQLTFALGRTLAGTLLLEQAAFDTAHDLKDAEEDILVAQRWCKAFEFTKPIIPVGPYEIQEEARIVFGHDAKI
ncbi:acyl-CoA dehydrogenase/oxidase C-terminal [Mycotypha africana]|uniref:acyl-CoA dehydrogenase/oxidase C-terminal n=1 Tax=Mycotypha africana TaxID=64632 RepID=UPI00230002DD|nr:acyl-CoA dehydrogenase/oxidase C-terminal [Mycotypha africana]KAI8977138.1 acyl-CoA dehydrogenase/oxidase C-terminal [Mycotypha africana]